MFAMLPSYSWRSVNVKLSERKNAVLIRQGWTAEQITRRRIVTAWKMTGLVASAALTMAPADSWSNVGIVGVCWSMAALVIGIGNRE